MLMSFLQTINKLKPASSKGVYIKSITMSSTMGLGLSRYNIYLKNLEN